MDWLKIINKFKIEELVFTIFILGSLLLLFYNYIPNNYIPVKLNLFIAKELHWIIIITMLGGIYFFVCKFKDIKINIQNWKYNRKIEKEILNLPEGEREFLILIVYSNKFYIDKFLDKNFIDLNILRNLCLKKLLLENRNYFSLTNQKVIEIVRNILKKD